VKLGPMVPCKREAILPFCIKKKASEVTHPEFKPQYHQKEKE
jgi:hypothetical protein